MTKWMGLKRWLIEKVIGKRRVFKKIEKEKVSVEKKKIIRVGKSESEG